MNQTKRKLNFIFASIFAVGFALAGSLAFAEAEHKWKMATSWGGGPLMELGAKAFANRVNLLYGWSS